MDTSKPIRILMLEDSPGDLELAQHALRESGIAFLAQQVATREAFTEALAGFRPDIVVADYRLPSFDGRSALDLVRARTPEVPVIILSGALGDEQAVDLIKAGARDYVLKDRLARLGTAVSQALEDERQILQRKAAEAALRESLARLRLLMKAGNVGLWDWNLLTNVVFFSPEWKAQLGYADDEVPGRYEEWESRLHPDDLARALEAVRAFVGGARPDYHIEFRLRHKDGSWRWILARADKEFDANGKPVHLMGCHIDITERKAAEESLARRAAELEQFHSLSVGRELQMIELKKEVNELAQRAGEQPRYDLSFLDPTNFADLSPSASPNLKVAATS